MLPELRAQLGEDGRFGAAWAAGHAMTLDAAIADVIGHRSV